MLNENEDPSVSDLVENFSLWLFILQPILKTVERVRIRSLFRKRSQRCATAFASVNETTRDFFQTHF